ncbi:MULTISPECIES: hypothetical protein [unclassified Streptomyces]|uniref:hypothetical protein n=1 Tax=unclassified Streptomyces TaxID=2593676 RepID=UPI00278C4244|nr:MULTISPECIES: hypothetical protein [unclassified Streptomyces]
MNLYIDPLNGLVVTVGCVVGYLVYRRPVSSTDDKSQRDLAGGAASALATILILAFLLGLGDGQSTERARVEPHPTPTSQPADSPTSTTAP